MKKISKVQSDEMQYLTFLNDKKKNDLRLGAMRAHDWYDDPKRLAFTFSRYKFVSKMLTGKTKVLEIGAGDGFASKLILEEVKNLYLSDFKDEFISRLKKLYKNFQRIKILKFNPLTDQLLEKFDGIYLLDVMEHISGKNDNKLLRSLISLLEDDGVCIIGMPSIESQKYASVGSLKGHVNCKTGEELKRLMLKYFQNVFLFSMNDEVVHTGFSPMAHYILSIGVSPKKPSRES